jgi:hypothetical protein
VDNKMPAVSFKEFIGEEKRDWRYTWPY